MARRTFQVIDVVGVLQHWHAGRPEAVVAASLGGREDGPQVRPSPPRRRGSGRVMTTSWTGPAQRRYEALRAYFVEGLAAAEAGARFGYSAATMHQLASDLRAGRVALLVSGKPGPKGPRTALRVRGRVLELRAADSSVTEIAAALTAAGTPVSAQTVWSILAAEGLERLPRRD